MKYGAWCCAVWLLAAASLTAVDKMTVRITPTMAIGPATVRIHVFTEQDADNRALEVVADSGDFYRSSLVPLDGNRAPRAADFVFTDLPPGQYLVRAALIGSNGNERFSVTRFLNIS